MAFPRVFISSTCYDLGEIRDSLVAFIQTYFYEPILSEKGDIFYHPDLHTHESCISEISNCHLLILIIGGRFGGNYTSDLTKSITNAEYNAAKKLNIPVFTFIKREVFEDHRVYQNNKKNPVLDQIVFPSIDKQEHAKHIFEFINDVRFSDVNNGFFSFEYAKDIKEMLGKQWAGMICDFLNKRIKEKEQNAIKNVLDNLTLVNKKTEEILENIYRKVDETLAPNKIKDLDDILISTKLFLEIFNTFEQSQYVDLNIDIISAIDPQQYDLVSFLVKTGNFILEKDKVSNDKVVDVLFNKRKSIGYHVSNVVDGLRTPNEFNKDLFDRWNSMYVDKFRGLTLESRKKVFLELYKSL